METKPKSLKTGEERPDLLDPPLLLGFEQETQSPRQGELQSLRESTRQGIIQDDQSRFVLNGKCEDLSFSESQTGCERQDRCASHCADAQPMQ